MIDEMVIDGVPVLVAPADGPLRGGLTFRVGRADETLVRSGITHMVEHLALHRLGLADYHYNGTTGITVTHFFSQGSAKDVADYLQAVCAGLTDPPFDRLEVEKQILAAEAASRAGSPMEQLPLWRYGARGYGIASYPEWGLFGLTADDLRAWIARYFTRENAVAWFTGPPPAGLRLALPSGSRRPLPPVTSALPTTPAFITGPARVVGLHTIVERGAAGQVFAGVLDRALFRTLRQDGGLSYTAVAAYEPRDLESAAIVGLADAHDEAQGKAVAAFVAVLANLRDGHIDPADLDAVVARASEAYDQQDFEAVRLPAAAFDLLTGRPRQSLDDLRRTVAAVTVVDVHRLAEQAWANALLMVPPEQRGDVPGIEPAPANSATVVVGPRLAMHGHPDISLVLGADGVSVVTPAQRATVLFADCAALLAWPDGGRLLVGNDGVTCRVEPTLYPVEPEAVQRLTEAVPAQVVVAMPPRAAEDIPQWTPPAPPAALFAPAPTTPDERRRQVRATVLFLLVLTLPLVALSAWTTIIFTVDGWQASDALATIAWGFTAYAISLNVKAWRLAQSLRP